MMGIPAVSVSNWLIPDVTPSRFPECNYSFVFMTKKEELTDYIADILNNYDAILDKVDHFRKTTFGEVGTSSKQILDMIDDCVAGRKIRYEALKPASRKLVPVKKYLYHNYEKMNREIFGNYCVRYKAVDKLYTAAKNIKHKLDGKNKK